MFVFQGLLENDFHWLPVPKSKGKASVFTALLAKLLLDQVVALVQTWRDNQNPQAVACPETSTLCFPLSPSWLTCEPGPRLGPGGKPHLVIPVQNSWASHSQPRTRFRLSGEDQLKSVVAKHLPCAHCWWNPFQSF